MQIVDGAKKARGQPSMNNFFPKDKMYERRRRAKQRSRKAKDTASGAKLVPWRGRTKGERRKHELHGGKEKINNNKTGQTPPPLLPNQEENELIGQHKTTRS